MAARVARRPASRTAEPRRGALAVLIASGLVLVLAGCGHEPVERTGTVPDEIVDGYAYTAVLVSRHPLWGALRDLEAALVELDADEWEPVLPPIDDRFVEIAFIESYALGDAGPRMAALRGGWRDAYPPLLLPTEGLGQDLRARIDWEQRQADQMIARQMAQARSAESRRLAQLRVRLVEQYQERLTNLSIQATIREGEAAERARAQRDQVWEIIEAEVEATREACEERLGELEARLRRQAAARVEEARVRAKAVAEDRAVQMRGAGAGLYEEMIGRMERPWPQPEGDEAIASAQMQAEPANRRLEQIDLSREAAEAARREKAGEQRERMAASLGRLRSTVAAGTETAAKVVAYRNGIRLETLPGGRPQGRDVTDLIAGELEDFWKVGRE